MIKQAEDPKLSADDDSSGKNILEDKRLLGIAAAGLLGGTAGALVAPDFIYKKPTWYNRLLLGTGTGLSSAAIVAAAIAAMDNEDKAGIGAKAKNFFENLPNSLFGGKPKKDTLNQLNLGGKAAYGAEGGGLGGWIVRNWFKRPFGSIRTMFGKREDNQESDKYPSVMQSVGSWSKTLAGAGIPLFTWHQVTKGLNNRQRARQFLALAKSHKGLSSLADLPLGELQRRLNRGLLGTTHEVAKAAVAGPAQILGSILGGRHTRLGRKLHRFGRREILSNPFLQTAGTRSSGFGASSRSLLGEFNRNSNLYGVQEDLKNFVNAPRTNKQLFRGSRWNRAIGLLAMLAMQGTLGGLNSFGPWKDNDYERMVNSLNDLK